MATLAEIGVSAAISLLTMFVYLMAYALLKNQPINDKVYFPKFCLSGEKISPNTRKFVKPRLKTCLTFLNWMPQALKTSEEDIISMAGLDSAAFLRIYRLGFKIFVPVTLVAIIVLIPVNMSSGTLESVIDRLSISNVPSKSLRFLVHIGLQYLFTAWTCFVLYKEYRVVAKKRLEFLASQHDRADEFTVLVRNIPNIPDKLLSDRIDEFFQTNHPDTYVGHKAVYDGNKYFKFMKEREKLRDRLDYYQLKFEKEPEKRPIVKTGALELWGKKVDAIDHYRKKIEKLDKLMILEHEKIIQDPKSVAFISFNSRLGAFICAQTQQSEDHRFWLTDWAPEPRDVYWKNLAIPSKSMHIREFLVSISLFVLVFFNIIPIAFVQSLALKQVTNLKFMNSIAKAILPGLVLKIFLLILPILLKKMTRMEGYTALSTLERKTASKYYFYMVVNVFLGSLVTEPYFWHNIISRGLHFQWIFTWINFNIPRKATFFMTYMMMYGWTGTAGEILRLMPLLSYHFKKFFLIKSEREEEKAMDPGGVDFVGAIPTLQFYFLLGTVYAVLTPIILPIIIVSFGFAYLIYCHQLRNVYRPKYESAAAFWPDVHSRVITSLVISHMLLMAHLLFIHSASKYAATLVFLPILTYTFHRYCKSRFEPIFRRKYSLEGAMLKDSKHKRIEPDAYLHPALKSVEVAR